MGPTYTQVTLAGDKRLRRRNTHHALGTTAVLSFVLDHEPAMDG